MRFDDVKGRKVVSTATAEAVGKVHKLVIDPDARTVLAIELKKTSGGNSLLWSDLLAFGEDAVTIDDAVRVTESTAAVEALSGKERQLFGKRVLSSNGNELGTVTDIDFDADSGAITSLVLKDSEVAGTRLLGVGSWAVVVAAE